MLLNINIVSGIPRDCPALNPVQPAPHDRTARPITADEQHRRNVQIAREMICHACEARRHEHFQFLLRQGGAA